MELSRRKMVTVTGLTLLTAGCSSPSPDPQFRLGARVSTAPSDPFTLAVETRNADITAEKAGKLAVTYQNAGDESATLNLGPAEPHPRTSEAESPGIVLEDPQANIEKEPGVAGCQLPTACHPPLAGQNTKRNPVRRFRRNTKCGHIRKGNPSTPRWNRARTGFRCLNRPLSK